MSHFLRINSAYSEEPDTCAFKIMKSNMPRMLISLRGMENAKISTEIKIIRNDTKHSAAAI